MSQEIQEAVYKQQEVIKDKQLSVKQDLDQVEPAVIEAQNGMVVQFVTCCLLIKKIIDAMSVIKVYIYNTTQLQRLLVHDATFNFILPLLPPLLVIIHPLFI